MNFTQPAGLNSVNGVILTVGIRANADRCAIVIPIVTDDSSKTKKSLCEDCTEAADAILCDVICACISEDAYISFISAEGMVNGSIPHRIDYGPLDFPGTAAAGCETSQVAGLITFYSEPADLPAGSRVRVGKQFVPGIADSDVVGNAVSAGLLAKLDILLAFVGEGYADSVSPTYKWYRVIAAPTDRTAGHDVIRSGTGATRGYTGTQRRRLVPH